MLDRRASRKSKPHGERHQSGRAGCLRAAVLGSDDAIVSTASLMIGVAASSASQGATLIAGGAGLVAGAMSMAVGEYVSVSAQRTRSEPISCGKCESLPSSRRPSCASWR
jgi:VIT1/CCC1 family predicted Fe2+/Mn2+ transporter